MPLLAPRTEAGRLTLRYREGQTRRAALIAALVATYYRQKVVLSDPRSVERWLDLMIPKVLDEVDRQAKAAAIYGNKVRKLELGFDDGYRWEPIAGSVADQIRSSLAVVGPSSHTSKRELIEDKVAAKPAKDRKITRQALERDAKQAVETQIMGSVLRHAQSGGRQTLFENQKEDPVALGYVRVTRDKPCYFCVMLASRGVVYGADSFDESDPRFTGDGTVKVHDSCQCTFKPVYTPQTDDYVARSDFWEAMWREFSGGSKGPIKEFRAGYTAWLKDPSLFTG
jgi:hypothetical protein